MNLIAAALHKWVINLTAWPRRVQRLTTCRMSHWLLLRKLSDIIEDAHMFRNLWKLENVIIHSWVKMNLWLHRKRGRHLRTGMQNCLLNWKWIWSKGWIKLWWRMSSLLRWSKTLTTSKSVCIPSTKPNKVAPTNNSKFIKISWKTNKTFTHSSTTPKPSSFPLRNWRISTKD